MDDSTKRQMKIMKKRRAELGFRQEDVAEEAGISLQQYQNFENGRRKVANCSTILGLRICAALELDTRMNWSLRTVVTLSNASGIA